MVLGARDVLRALIERIEAAHPAPALFDAGECEDWDADAFGNLLASGVLVRSSTRTASTICRGCEWHCSKPVDVRRTRAGVTRAFIVCDEEPEYGRIPVPIGRLALFSASLRSLSLALAQGDALFDRQPMSMRDEYGLGIIKGRLGPRHISVRCEANRLELIVGSHSVSLGTLLSLKPEGLRVDARGIGRLVDRKDRLEGTGTRPRNRTRQVAKKRKTRSRDIAILIRAKTLHEQGMDWTAAAKKISGQDIAKGLSAGRVRRIIYAERSRERKNSRSNP